MERIFTIFIYVFLLIAAAGLVVSLIFSKNTSLSKECRITSVQAFVITLILLYLQFVFLGK